MLWRHWMEMNYSDFVSCADDDVTNFETVKAFSIIIEILRLCDVQCVEQQETR
jgi:hypothetical protein